MMDITKYKLIELLNNDLTLEYAAAVQYIQHAAVITGPQYGEILKELIIHSTEEMQHATTLAGQIAHLGGTPTADVADRHTSKSSEEMLEQDLDGEEGAVARYTERIQQAEELKLYALAKHLRDILAMEQEHVMDLQLALGK